MKDVFNYIKIFVTGIMAFISAKLGILAPLIAFLAIAMIMDYISGMISSGQKGDLSSKRGIVGILKKLGYVIAIVVALICDQLIIFIAGQFNAVLPSTAIFGMLTTIWLTLNELLSILENLGKMGVPLPKFLGKMIYLLRDTVDEKSEK
ncbi:MAG: phage holin family protein [Oscillospiraceae bacterium]